MQLSIEYIDIDQLTEYAGNSKKHTEYDVQLIQKSIQQFGFNDAIGVWGKDNLIVEGHGRYLAAKNLGIKRVPIIRLDHLTDEQRRAYTIIHNQLTLNTQFDTDLLRTELEGITDVNMDDFDIGLDREDIQPQHIQSLYTDTPVEKKQHKPKQYICPCCGKTFTS